jgi:hypothetical protein
MMPNTTNALDGQFADLKNRLRTHKGLSKERKIKFIDGFLRHETTMVIYVSYAIKRTVKTDNPNNCSPAEPVSGLSKISSTFVH